MLKWDNKCLNVWIGGTTFKDKFYNCRITDTGSGIVLVIQQNGTIVHRETYIDTIENVKLIAEQIIHTVK